MRSKVVLLILLTGISINAIAQNSSVKLKVEYIERVKIRNDSAALKLKYNTYKDFLEKNADLYIINDSSYYTYNEYRAKKKLFAKIADSVSLDPGIALQQNILSMEFAKMNSIKDFNTIYVKNLAKNIIAINDFTYDGVVYKKYFINDTAQTIQWKLINEIKKIDSFICQKAVGKFRGRVWEAWFTSQIPVASGPWKLSGLPGLILEAGDTSNLYQFTCRSIQIPVKEIDKSSLIVTKNAEKISMGTWSDILYLNHKKHIEEATKLVKLVASGTPSQSGPQVENNLERFRIATGDLNFPYNPIEIFEQY